MALNKSYITHPQRIYHNPLSPETSDYDEIIPVTTSDAVVIEGTTTNLTEYMKDYLVSGTDKRNSTITGENIVTQDSTGVQVGNFIATIASGFTSRGKSDDTILDKSAYTTLASPTSSDNFLILKVDGNFEYVRSFDGGRSFPLNPENGDIYFNDQLRQSYKYAAGSPGTWEPYPCTAIARFEEGILSEILPFNTWWWDEILYDSLETDIPVGMELGSIYDNGNLLKVNPGSLVDNNVFYKIPTPILKNITQIFSSGSGNGSADGSYTVELNNLVPTDITPSNNYGYLIKAYSDSMSDYTNAYGSFNPNYDANNPRWQAASSPAYCEISLPENEKACIRKYSVTSYGDVVDSICTEWKLYGSNDGNNWDLIHYVANSGFTINGQTNSWVTNSGVEYHYFKFVMLGNIGGNLSKVSMGQIRLYSGSPKINVFVISNGINTDILTSKYENPQLPTGYNTFKQIGSVVLTADDVPNLTDIYPKEGLSSEFVKGFPTLSQKINNRLTTNLDNISRDGMLYLTNASMPQYGRTDYQELLPGVVYQAKVPGYIWYISDVSPSRLGIYGSFDRKSIDAFEFEQDTCLWRLDSAEFGLLCASAVVPITKGMYYKIVLYAGNYDRAVFVPTVGYQYNN